MFFDLFRQIYRVPLILMRSLLANPLSMFVYGIMSKWYIMVMLTAIIVTFWVFKGLEKAGVLQAAEKTVSKALSDAKSIAQNCTPLIMDLNAAWACVQNPPEYVQNDDEIKLQHDIDAAVKQIPGGSKSSSSSSGVNRNVNPYNAGNE